MHRMSVSQAWEETRSILARDGRLIATVALAIVVLPQTILGLLIGQPSGERSATAVLALFVSLVLGLVAQIALNRLAIGPSITVGGAISRGVTRTPALLGSVLLVGVLLFLLMIPLVIVLGLAGLIRTSAATGEPSVGAVLIILLVTPLVYAIFQLAVPTAAAEGGGSFHLLKRSWQLSKGNYLKLLGFVLIMFVGLIVVFMAGQFAFGAIIAAALGPPDHLSLSALLISLVTAAIQALFTVVFAVMLARIYAQLAGGREAQASVPSSGT